VPELALWWTSGSRTASSCYDGGPQPGYSHHESESVKPSRFEYTRAETLEHTTALLDDDPDGSKLIAGGQSLLPLIRLRLTDVARLVDIGGLGELAGIAVSEESLTVGAITRQSVLENHPQVRRHTPLLADAIPLIAHQAIRNRGTLGGSLAHADRSAELPAVAVALDASVLATSTRGSRVIPADDLFVSDYVTGLAEDEVLTTVNFPIAATDEVGEILEVSRRQGDFALAGVVVRIGGRRDHCEMARFVAFGVGPRPIRVRAVEEALVGSRLEDKDIDAAAERIANAVTPQSDVHASADYRRDAATALGRRAIRRARDRLTAAAARRDR
jgi:carbon-monoxide dehydrogenase medium subunit